MFKTRLRISKPGREARFRRLSHKFGKPWSLTDCAWMRLALFVYSNLTNTGYPKIVNKCDSGVWREVQLAGLHVYLWGLGIRWVYVAFVLVIHPLLFVKNMRFWVQIPCCTSMTQETLNLPGDAAAMKLMFALHSCNLAVILAQGPCAMVPWFHRWTIPPAFRPSPWKHLLGGFWYSNMDATNGCYMLYTMVIFLKQNSF